MFRIPGYEPGVNITLLNVLYFKQQKQENGKYGSDYLYIIFKDLDTNEKKIHMIKEPEYTYFISKPEYTVNYNRLFIEEEFTYPVTCKYKNLLKDIAERTNNLNFFYDNIRNGNSSANKELLKIPSIFRADMDIENFYMLQFNNTYKNEPYKPHKIFLDIEVDIKNARGDFVEPGECPVNAITIIDGLNKKSNTLLLINPEYNNMDEFMKNTDSMINDLRELVRDEVHGYKEEIRYELDKFDYNIMYYNDEIALIADAFNYINTIKPDFCLIWNAAFDIPYLIERCRVLGYDPGSIMCTNEYHDKRVYYYIDNRAEKTEEKNDYAFIPSYTIYLCQMITFASRRKGQKKGVIKNNKLNTVSEAIARIKKLDFSHITRKISELPYLNYKIFVFYNIIDVIAQYCIEYKVEDVDFVFTKSLNTCTKINKVHRQITYLANNAVKDFKDMKFIIGNNVNKGNEKQSFAGAFVADPLKVSDKPKLKINGVPINILLYLVDFDYTALYPSIIDQSNMAPNTQYGKIIIDEVLDNNENRFNNNYFDRAVYFMEDYISHDRLSFCSRYLRLPTYEQMYDAIIHYYNYIKPLAILPTNYINTVTGKVIMGIVLNHNNMKASMCNFIDNKKIDLCTRCDILPRMENNNGL